MSKAIIGGRYQYNSTDPIKKTATYSEFRCMDKALNNKQMVLQIHQANDSLMEKIKDIKHPFITPIIDIVPMEDQKVAFITQFGSVCTVQTMLKNTGFMLEEDALVLLKYMLTAVKELHQKLIVCNRVCADNFVFYAPGIIKFSCNTFEGEMPIEYRSPESLQNIPTTYQSDIYCLGVMLYKMVYGRFPFKGQDAKEMLKSIKGKKFIETQEKSPFEIMISKQTHYLMLSMLDYYAQNRPQIQSILKIPLMGFSLEVDSVPANGKSKRSVDKGSIIPQPFYKKYLVFKHSKISHPNTYYSEETYMVLDLRDKKLMTLHCPIIKMFETEPRKVQSYYEKLKVLKENYTIKSSSFLCRIDQFDKFRQEPVIVTEYCNQGDLYSYLQKRKVSKGWLNNKEINVLMYVLAMGLKQVRELGLSVIHSLSANSIMIINKGIKIRQPMLLSTMICKKLYQEYQKIDYFAPELKQQNEFVQLQKTDMWSYGVLYYYLLSGKLPIVNEQNQIQLSSLKTNQKNKNVIGKCLDQSSNSRMSLENIKLQQVDEDLLNYFLKQEQQLESDNFNKMEEESLSSEDPNLENKKQVMFKHRKKRVFKNYNKIIAQSSTKSCRICTKVVINLIILWILFFGIFFVNGGVGIIKSNYYRPITLTVPYNLATSLYPLTILTTSGAYIQTNYFQYSYQQFTKDLRCMQNKYTSTAPGLVSDYINGASHAVMCLYGFAYAIAVSLLYIIQSFRLDFPTIIMNRNQNKQNKQLYHYIFLTIMLPFLLFCFFYIFALEYIIQMTPCLGIQNLAYPQFTSVYTLLTRQTSKYFLRVFLTVILWSFLMFIFGYMSLYHKKLNTNIYEWKVIIPSISVMALYGIICRIGFGSSTPLEPTFSYKMNMDILGTYYGFIGFIPQVLCLGFFIIQRIIDFIFWGFLRLGLQPSDEEDIKKVQHVKLKIQPINGRQQFTEANINMIEHNWQFD